MIRLAIVLMFLLTGCIAIVDDGRSKRVECEDTAVVVINLEYATAVEAYEALRTLLVEPPPPPIVPDHRTNSIIVRGSPKEIERVKEVLSAVDVKAPRGDG